MTSKSQAFKNRNEAVRASFAAKEKQCPNWKTTSIIKFVAKKHFLAERTIEAIIKYEGIYAS